MKQRILVVEDDQALARILRDNLVIEGYNVEWVTDGAQVMSAVRRFAPDLILLDISLPNRNGFELCRMLSGGRCPIIILTARGEKADKLKGLTLGADDYITKPFDLMELLARIKVVLRRTSRHITRLMLGNVIVDFQTLSAVCGDSRVDLTNREFDLLRYLAERQGRVVSRSELLREIWGYADDPSTRSVDHAIARLRKKIEPDPQHPRIIRTAHGDGYCLAVEDGATTRD